MHDDMEFDFMEACVVKMNSVHAEVVEDKVACTTRTLSFPSCKSHFAVDCGLNADDVSFRNRKVTESMTVGKWKCRYCQILHSSV